MRSLRSAAFAAAAIVCGAPRTRPIPRSRAENISSRSAAATTATRPAISSASRTSRARSPAPMSASQFPGRAYSSGATSRRTRRPGLGAWTDDQIISAFTAGVRPDGRRLAPIMPWQGLSHLTADDAHAIVAYLRSLPPVKNAVPGPFGPKEIAFDAGLRHHSRRDLRENACAALSRDGAGGIKKGARDGALRLSAESPLT